MSTHDKSLPLLFENRIDWLDTKQAAQYLKLTEGALRQMVYRGTIKVSGKIGRLWRFRKDELDRSLEASLKGGF